MTIDLIKMSDTMVNQKLYIRDTRFKGQKQGDRMNPLNRGSTVYSKLDSQQTPYGASIADIRGQKTLLKSFV